MKLACMEDCLRDDDYDSELDDDIFAPDEDMWRGDDDMDRPSETLFTLHHMICERKFLNPRRNLAKSRDYILNYFQNQPDDSFRKITRVSHSIFNHIIELIQFHPVFQNVSTYEQAPVHWQLACALDRLGNDGQGVSHARSKLIWGIGQGTVHLYTRQVVQALWDLKHLYIRWPTTEERLQTSRQMEAKGFKHAIGFVDGTCIPLHKKPTVCGNIFMDRKKRYSINAQVICDDQHKVVFFMTGHLSSCGDSRVFTSSVISKHPELHFSGRQYLLFDSTYAVTPTIIPAYKENMRDDRGDPQEPRKIERFNTFLAKARVVNEHIIGILKARWSSLRGMRVDIHKREDMETFVRQATVCVVLHNLCLDSDPWDEDFVEQEEDEPEDEEIEQHQQRPRLLSQGQRRRWEVRQACMAFHGHM